MLVAARMRTSTSPSLHFATAWFGATLMSAIVSSSCGGCRPGPGGGPPARGVLLQQLRNVHLQRRRELLEGAQRRILSPGFETREVGAADARLLGELLLRHTAPLSERLEPHRHTFLGSHFVPYRVQRVKCALRPLPEPAPRAPGGHVPGQQGSRAARTGPEPGREPVPGAPCRSRYAVPW